MPESNYTAVKAAAREARRQQLQRIAEANQAERRRRNAEKSRRCAKRKAERGACVKCGKLSKQYRCDECKKTHNDEAKRLRDERIAQDKCEKCGEQVAGGIHRCEKCQKKNNERRREQN